MMTNRITVTILKITIQGSVLSPIMFAIYLNDVHTARSLTPRSYIILFADDILLIAPSVSELQSLFHLCEIELNWLDMSINDAALELAHVVT